MNATVIPFRGNKPLAYQPGTDQQPLPWTYSNGFIWDANRRVVGSTVEKRMAELVVRSVNLLHGYDTAEHRPDADQA